MFRKIFLLIFCATAADCQLELPAPSEPLQQLSDIVEAGVTNQFTKTLKPFLKYGGPMGATIEGVNNFAEQSLTKSNASISKKSFNFVNFIQFKVLTNLSQLLMNLRKSPRNWIS